MKESRYNVWVEREDAVYVFNGVSGALLRVPRDYYADLRSYLNGSGGKDCSPQLLKQLAIGHMILSDNADELALLSQRYHVSRRNNSNFALTIVTSLGCNFDCPYCFEAKHPSIMNEEIEEAVLQVLDDQLLKIRNFTVLWFGGEPLVGKKPLLALSDAFIERCERANVDYSAEITTNGYLLDLETCKQLRDRRVSGAQICLDGPPEVHDRMRPLAGGKSSFWRIVQNLHHAVDYLDVAIRMNVHTGNFGYAEELLEILKAEGLAGRLTVYPGRIVGVKDDVASPSATYEPDCFTSSGFAKAELEFKLLAMRYGFSSRSLPSPTGAPCTAVRANELVVGSKGELYKCLISPGNPLEVIGHIRDYKNVNGRLQKWLNYDPFSNAECRGCIALPVCMGGCAHHAMDSIQYENRCGTFRYNYREQVLSFVEAAEREGFPEIMSTGQLARRMETR